MHEISEAELEKLHQIFFKMLKDFDALCRKNCIRYFLGGGTLLGAVRHQGFIPWDDDVDVMMLREDYERLCSLPPEQFPPYFFFQTIKTDRNYHGDMSKIRLHGTTYSTEFSKKNPDMHQGIFIDIFVHDKTAKSLVGQKLHIFLTTFFRSMVFHKWEKTPMQFYGRYKCLCRIATVFNRMIPIGCWQTIRELSYICFKNSSSSYLYDGMGQHLQHGAFPSFWLEKEIRIPFEGTYFPVPWKYEEYLRYSYGDYMSIPKPEERRKHNIDTVDFGQY